MPEIRTPKIGSHITNSNKKRPRMTVNLRIGSRKKTISGSHILEIADKKTASNKGCLYSYLKSFKKQISKNSFTKLSKNRADLKIVRLFPKR